MQRIWTTIVATALPDAVGNFNSSLRADDPDLEAAIQAILKVDKEGKGNEAAVNAMKILNSAQLA
jgi:hypothetical protein